MKVLPQSAGYAILAMCCLARCDGDWHTAKAIAACTGIPFEFLRKVLARLERSRLLESKRGYLGGFRLLQEPGEISLADIVQAAEPGALEDRCFFGLTECSDDRPCAAHSFWKKARGEVREFLSNTSLAEASNAEWSRKFLDMNLLVSPEPTTIGGRPES